MLRTTLVIAAAVVLYLLPGVYWWLRAVEYDINRNITIDGLYEDED